MPFDSSPRSRSPRFSRTGRGLLGTALVFAMCTSGCSWLSESTEPMVSKATVSVSTSVVDKPKTKVNCGAEPEISSMTLEHRIAQLLTVGVSNFEDASAALDNYKIGGIFIGSDVAEHMLGSGELDELERRAPIHPLIAIDEEGGRVSRIKNIVGEIPSAREMAKTMSPEEVHNLGVERGRELRRLGITVDYAPSIDVSDQNDDEVIGDRSFSNDPQEVIDYGRAFAQGLLEAGITPVFKHFPGHGHSSGDSHLTHVTVPPLEQLIDKDLKPFAELVGMPDTAVMVGHLETPGLTDPGEPASMSPAAYSLLREGTGYSGKPYRGVIFTDDLSGMRAITDRFTVPEAVVQALIAGADSPLWSSTAEIPDVIEAVKTAIADGRLREEQINDSVRRLNALRASTQCHK